MALWDKKFVRCFWEEELEGKLVFIADTVVRLQALVEGGGERYKAKYSGYASFPYKDSDDERYRFCYYDPLYDIKQAFFEGKQIEVRRDGGDKWEDCDEPSWILGAGCYRVKEEQRATKRDLAQWLARGNGEYLSPYSLTWFAQYTYTDGKEDEELEEGMLVRRWEEASGHEPTKQYLEV